MATNATVRSPPLIFLHFRLSSIKYTAHFTVVEQLMAEYYHEDESELLVIDLPFNFGSKKAIKNWKIEAANYMSGISQQSHVVVFVTTHSDPESGDLWLGYDDKKDKPWAAKVDEVST